MNRWRPVVVLSALVTAMAGAVGAPAASSPAATATSTAKVNCVAYAADGTCEVLGVVYAIAQAGGRTYVGGAFEKVNGVARSNVAAIRADGTLDPTWNPSTNGVVYALAASSDGSRVFLGGGFTAVNGQARSRLAAVSADTGDLVAGWTTSVGNNLVRALATDSGGRLYVGGSYGTLGGRSIARLGAVSQSTGAVDTTFRPAPNNTVRALALTDDGSRLYAGGPFTAIGGRTRPGMAEITAATGAVTAFAPTNGGVVIAVDVAPNGRFFGSTTNNRTWAYDPADGGALEYVVRTSGDVQAILATDEEVYIGGHFSTFPEANLKRLHIGSFFAADGRPTAWNPGANGEYGVWAFALTRTPLSPTATPALSVGGDFTVVAGAARRGYARFRL